MELNDHPGFQPRQDFQEHDRRVRVHETAVRVIDVQDVARLKLLEEAEIDIFDRRSDDPVTQLVDLGPGLGVHGDELCSEDVVPDRPGHELGGVARTNFEVAGGLVQPDQTVQRYAVQGRHPAVDPVRFRVVSLARVHRNLFQSWGEWQKRGERGGVRVTVLVEDAPQLPVGSPDRPAAPRPDGVVEQECIVRRPPPGKPPRSLTGRQPPRPAPTNASASSLAR